MGIHWEYMGILGIHWEYMGIRGNTRIPRIWEYMGILYGKGLTSVGRLPEPGTETLLPPLINFQQTF